MRVEISDVGDLPDPAKQRMEQCVRNHAEALLQEAGRLEAANRSTNGDPEVTSSMVKDADTILRKGYHKPKKSKVLIVIQILAYVCTLLTGFYFQMLDTGKVGPIPFALSLFAAVVLSAIALLKD